MKALAETTEAGVLRQFRQMRGFTQAQAAEWYGVTERSWRRYENTNHMPRPLAKRIMRYAQRRIIQKLNSL